MKLYIQSDNVYGYIPLSSKPITEDSIADADSLVTKLDEVIPAQSPGTFTITNVEYKAYTPQSLNSTVKAWSTTKHYYTYSTNGSKINTVDSSRTASTDPLTFSDTELLNLVDILTLLAKVSHTHSGGTEGGTSTATYTQRISPTQTSGCYNHNNGSNSGNQNNAAWGW